MPNLSLGEIYRLLLEIFPETELVGSKTLMLDSVAPMRLLKKAVFLLLPIQSMKNFSLKPKPPR